MKLKTEDIFKVVKKEEIEYVDKETGEIKKFRKLYITNTKDEIQEQVIINNEDLYKKIQEKTNVRLIYDKNFKATYLTDIEAVKL